MGLEEIIKNIELDTKARAKQILDDAAAQAEKTYLDADAKATDYIGQMGARDDNEAKQLIVREQSRANIEAKGIYQRAVNDAINGSLITLHSSLGSYVQGADYPKLLGKLAQLAVSELGSGCTLFLQKKDVQRIKQQNCTVEEAKESFVGGLRGVSKDGSMLVDYSIEKITDSLKDEIAVRLLDLIKE